MPKKTFVLDEQPGAPKLIAQVKAYLVSHAPRRSAAGVRYTLTQQSKSTLYSCIAMAEPRLSSQHCKNQCHPQTFAWRSHAFWTMQ